MKKSLNLILICTGLAILFYSCSKKEEFNIGNVINNIYVNSFFKINYPIPENAEILTEEKMRSLGMSINENVLNKDIENGSVELLTIFIHKIGSTNEFNPSVGFLAQKVSQPEKIKTGIDVISSIKAIYANDGVQFKESFLKEISGKADGLTFSVWEIALLDHKPLKQMYLAYVKDEIGLLITCTYETEEQKKELISPLYQE